jgi:23S rRNA (uracil1939-C5)-methyltransferase
MLEKNSIHDIEINDYTHEGLGVGKINDIAVFVQGVVKGEKVRVKLIKINKNFVVGKLLKIITISQNREKPFCDIFSKCGGCHIQHLKYEEQLAFKNKHINDCITRIAKIKDYKNDKIIGMENPLQYRNKAQYPVKLVDNIINTGFYAKKSHEIILNNGCLIQNKKIEDIKNFVIKVFRKCNISIYNEETNKGLLRHIVIKHGFATDESLLILVINGNKIPEIEKIIKEINKNIKLTGVIININKNNNNVILGKKNICVFGRNFIYDCIGEYKYKISTNSFYQVNTIQTKKLYDRVLEYLKPKGDEVVLDLYCGIGTIGIYISNYVKRIIGVEIVHEAIIDARENAKINNVKNIEFFEGKSEDIISNLYEKVKKVDSIIIDPPRKGCDEKLLETITLMNPKKIVYVSCNPSTLARDVKFLNSNGFKLNKVGGVDMFPGSFHVESLALIERLI